VAAVGSPRHARGPQRGARLATLAAACAVALAACGGDQPAPATTSTAAAPAPDERERLEELLTDALVAEGVSRRTARCAAVRIGDAVAAEELRSAAAGLADGGDVPPELLEAAFEAGRECADRRRTSLRPPVFGGWRDVHPEALA
jgi:hypothetical protein